MSPLFGRSRGRAKGGRRFRGGRGSGDFRTGSQPANCICPNCGLIEPHQPGMPCFQKKCPKCGSPMARQFSHEE